jgi:hypothetical protein
MNHSVLLFLSNNFDLTTSARVDSFLSSLEWLIRLSAVIAVAWLVYCVYKSYDDDKTTRVNRLGSRIRLIISTLGIILCLPVSLWHFRIEPLFIRPYVSVNIISETEGDPSRTIRNLKRAATTPMTKSFQCYYDSEQVTVNECLEKSLSEHRTISEALAHLDKIEIDSDSR